MPAFSPSTGNREPSRDACEVTLLELVQAICAETSDDREVVEVVRHLLCTGQVRLRGNFRDCAPNIFL